MFDPFHPSRPARSPGQLASRETGVGSEGREVDEM